MYLNATETAANDGRPVYDVCQVGTRELVGRVALGADDRWRITGHDESWGLAVEAIRTLMATES
jgi:hypothetical protein